MSGSRSAFLELETDPFAEQLADSALDAIDQGKEVSILANNTYVIKKESKPTISIPEPFLKTVYEGEEEEVFEAPQLKYFRPQLGAIDPAVIKFAQRLIVSNTVVLFTSGESHACKQLV